MSKPSTTITVADLIPEDAQYDFDPATNLATINIEVGRAHDKGGVQFADVTARLSVVGEGEDAMLEAEYVSHEFSGKGELSKEWIGYALLVIEANDFGVQMPK